MEEKEIVIEVSNGVVVGAYSNYPIKVILLDNDSIDSARTKQESEAFKDSLNGEFKEMKIVEWSDC